MTSPPSATRRSSRPPASSALAEPSWNDARDMEIAVLLFNIAVTMWPAAIFLFVYPSHILGGAYTSRSSTRSTSSGSSSMASATHRRAVQARHVRGENAQQAEHCLSPPMFASRATRTGSTTSLCTTSTITSGTRTSARRRRHQRDNVLHWVCYWSFMAGSWSSSPFHALIRKRWNLFFAGHRRVRADPFIVVRRLALRLRAFRGVDVLRPSWRCPPP